MAPSKPVKPLVEFAVTEVGKWTCEYLIEHTYTCKAYMGHNLPEKVCCDELVRAKNQILLPSHVSRILLDRVLEFWGRKRKIYSRSRKLQINLAIHVFTTLKETFLCEFVAKDHTDFSIIISPCGRNIRALRLFYREPLDSEDSFTLQFFWKNILNHMPHIQVIDFNWDVVTDKMLTAIAQNCTELRELRQVKFNDTLLSSTFRKFCFKDYPHQQTILNRVCQTLEVLEMHCSRRTSNSSRVREVMFDGCCMLMTHMPNLRSLGSHFFIEDLLFYVRQSKKQLFPTRIEEFCAAWFNEDLAKQLLKLFSKVVKIYLENPSRDMIDCIRNFPTLTNLSITYYDEMENRFLEKPLENITHLELLNLTMPTDLTSIQILCPNLQLLDLYCSEFGFTEIKWRPQKNAVFKCLQYVRMVLTQDTRNYEWVKMFSTTVKMLEISFGRIVEQIEIFNILMNTNFPCLERLMLSNALSISPNGIVNIAMHCRELREFGKFHFRLCDLQKVFDGKNIDINLVPDNS